MNHSARPRIRWRVWLLGAVAIAVLGLLSLYWYLYLRPPSVASIDEELTRLADLDLFAGVVLIGQQDEVLLHKAYGLADRENGVPFAQNTVSSIGSITKQFTAAAILRLQEEGRLRVTDTLGMYFPGAPPDKAVLSLHQLLTHSSGLPHSLGEDEDWIGREDYLAAVWSAELQFAPGTDYAYSNVGYSVLAAVVETLSSKGYEQFLHDSFFGPLGIRETGYWRPRWNLSRVARGYRGDELWGTVLEKQDSTRGFSWHLMGNGGVHSTALDMFRWFRALRRHRVLNEESAASLFERHVDEGSGDSFYGYGWTILDLPLGLYRVGHDGGNRYLFEDLQFFPQRGDLFYYLMVNDQQKCSRVSERITRRLLGQPLSMPPRLYPIEPADMSTWSGAYVLDSGERVMLDAVGPALRLRAPSLQADAEIFASERVTPDDLLQKSQQIEQVMGGILAGDLRPLFDAYGGRVPLADLERTYGERISNLEKLRGSILASRILGTRPQGDEQLTYFEIQCERGRVDGAYIWEDERLLGLDWSEQLPPALFYPSAQGRFEPYRLHGPSRGVLTIGDPLGDPIVIQIEHGGRPVSATRAED